MDNDRLLEQLDLNADLLARTAARGLTAPVPPCPGWTVRDVVEHTAEVYEHKIACMQRQAMPDPWPPQWPVDRDPIEWYADAHRRLRAELTERGPEAPAPTWWPPNQTVGFWVRRMAQETAVHRADVESAFGDITPVEQELAVDGIDEVLECMLSGDWSDEPTPSTGEVIGVHTGDRHWWVRLETEQVTFERGTRATDADVTGGPSEVLLWLWGRVPDRFVRTDGDEVCVEMLRERLAKATQ